MRMPAACRAVLAALAVALAAPDAGASTVAQNVAWTIDRSDTDEEYRIVVYGDSIFAGYRGSISSVAIFAAPTVVAEYASNRWQTDVEVIRRTKSGAKADDVYTNKIVDDDSWMQAGNTRVVAFEMCGNDGLQARDQFYGQNGTCDFTGLDQALADCTEYLEKAMIYINANAAPGVKAKIVSTLYYPGYDADDQPTNCDDPGTGLPLNRQDVFLPYLARMNWRACRFARMYGFHCADSFAFFMGGDYDSNDDGRRDSRALRVRRYEPEEDYVERITVTLRPTIRDANVHMTSKDSSYDYIQSDDTHPTNQGGTVFVGVLGGTGSGSSEPRFQPQRYKNRRGKNPIWKKFGHERMANAIRVHQPARP